MSSISRPFITIISERVSGPSYCLGEVETLVRRLHKIVPKFVEIIELPGEKKPYVRVDNTEINANGVISKIEKAVLS